MTKFFDRPVMEELTTMELCQDMLGAVNRVTTTYRRRLLAYRVRMVIAGLGTWFLIYVFWVGVMTVFGVSK